MDCKGGVQPTDRLGAHQNRLHLIPQSELGTEPWDVEKPEDSAVGVNVHNYHVHEKHMLSMYILYIYCILNIWSLDKIIYSIVRNSVYICVVYAQTSV